MIDPMMLHHDVKVETNSIVVMGLQQNSEQFQNKIQADLRMNTWVGPQQAIS